MRHYLIFVFLCAFTSSGLVLADSGSPAANEWSVQSSLGDVSVAFNGKGSSQRLKTRRTLTAPFSIKTGPTGQVILVRGDDTVLVSPGSELAVQAARYSDAGLVTRILQSIGSLVYQVEKRAKQRFEVATPYLVSVVKGTTFTISSSKHDTVVSLQEGSLEVLSLNGSHRALLEPGEIARTVQGTRGIEVINAEPQRSQWGSWHPSNATRDAGDSTKSGLNVAQIQVPGQTLQNPGRSDSAPGLSGTAPGLSGTAPGLSGTTPGLSGFAPGLSGTTPGLSGTAPGLSGTAPGLLGITPGLSGTAPGLSGTAPGLNK